MAAEQQTSIDQQNREFWDELCGSGLARWLGITEITRESLERFDREYLAQYPYLARYLAELPVEGRDVLEIGLGFGTVGQLLAARGARYHGADIAAGPAAMMRDRLRWLGTPADDSVVQASALELPWDAESFDFVVSIGCLHHTGDLPGAVGEVHRVLRPGGTALVMLCNAHSLRQLIFGSKEQVGTRYDANESGEPAPHTDYVSRRGVRRLFGAFSEVSVQAQNFDVITWRFARRRWTIPRERLLGNVGRVLGLDLYIRARK
jgi:ubiquinone/menaquinone biosynthesis C-methylase UbiE